MVGMAVTVEVRQVHEIQRRMVRKVGIVTWGTLEESGMI